MMIFHSYVKLPEGIPLLDDILNFFLSIHRLPKWVGLKIWYPGCHPVVNPIISPMRKNCYLRGIHHFQTHLDIIFRYIQYLYPHSMPIICIDIFHICWLDPHWKLDYLKDLAATQPPIMRQLSPTSKLRLTSAAWWNWNDWEWMGGITNLKNMATSWSSW